MKDTVDEIFNLIYALQYEVGRIDSTKAMDIEKMISSLSLTEKKVLLQKLDGLLSHDNNFYSKSVINLFYESIYGRICVEEKQEEINNFKK